MTDKPRRINRGYGVEKLCTGCDEYFPENREYFYKVSPSSQPTHVTAYENICIPCYNARKRKYKLEAKQRKQQKELNHV